jgi:hypothetical protein
LTEDYEVGKKRIAAINDRLAVRRARLWRLTSAIAVSSVILAGSMARAGEHMPDFARMDVNSTSATHGEIVSPHDYQGKVSGWYFGHAT